jgi:VanZ family protein
MSTPAAKSLLTLWFPPLLYVALIFVLSGMSHPPVPEGLDQNLLHFPEYAVLGILLARALQGGRPGRPGPGPLALALFLSVLCGLGDEIHQAFVPGRVPDVVDWYHDGIGAAAGIASWAGWKWLGR